MEKMDTRSRVCAESPDTYWSSSQGQIVSCVEGTDMYLPREKNKLTRASYSLQQITRADTALAATFKASFSIVEWHAQQEYAAMKKQVLEFRKELALFSDTV